MWAPILGLLLLGIWTLAPLHHHDDAHATCVVCVAGHAPAVAQPAVAASAPIAATPRILHTTPERILAPIFFGVASTRAPPSA
jgi:hypothetical protein